MTGRVPAHVIRGQLRNNFDISCALRRHAQRLRNEIQRLARGRVIARRPIVPLPPLLFGPVLLDRELASWEPLGRHARDAGTAYHLPPCVPGGGTPNFVRRRAEGRLSPPSQEDDAFYSPPSGPLPQTSTPRSRAGAPPLDAILSEEKVLPPEYLKPPWFPAIRRRSSTDEHRGFAPVDGDGAPLPPETNIGAFVAEYERNRRRLDDRRRAERSAAASRTSSESSRRWDVPGTSVEKFRSSLNNLSQIIDEMAELMHIGVAEASASEVQERAEALWGKEMAAQLSEEWSREASARGTESRSSSGKGGPGREPEIPGKPVGTSDEGGSRRRETGERSVPVVGRGETSPRQPRGHAQEESIRQSTWPITGPEGIGRPSQRTEARIDASPPMVHPSANGAPRRGSKRADSSKVTFRSRFLRSGGEKRPEEDRHGTSVGRGSAGASRSEVEADVKDAMTSQRIWKFEESTSDDVLDKIKQRRAEVCRTSIGSLPVEQKVANVKLMGPKKKKQKMCNMKIICIVSPAGDSTASSKSDVGSKGSASKSEQRFTSKSEQRVEDAAGFF